MTQQPSVQEANHWQREHVGEGEEAAVESASDAVGSIVVDISVDTRRTILTGERVVDHVVLRQQRTVGGRHHQPHETDRDGRVALSAYRTRADRVNYGQVPVQRHQHLYNAQQGAQLLQR